MPVDFSTDIGKVRALTGDTDDTNYRLSDAEITALLSLSNNSILLAAAQACESMAMKVTMELGNIKTLDFQSDAAKMAQAFMARAAALRTQYSEGEVSVDEIEFVEIGGHTFDYHWHNEYGGY